MMVCSNAFLMTIESSVERLSVLPRRLRSPVLKAAMEYSHRTMAFVGSVWDLRSTALGPNTAASTCRGS